MNGFRGILGSLQSRTLEINPRRKLRRGFLPHRLYPRVLLDRFLRQQAITLCFYFWDGCNHSDSHGPPHVEAPRETILLAPALSFGQSGDRTIFRHVFLVAFSRDTRKADFTLPLCREQRLVAGAIGPGGSRGGSNIVGG